MGSLFGNSVEVRGLEKLGRFLHEAHEVVTVVVAQDEQDVFTCCGRVEYSKIEKGWKNKFQGFHFSINEHVHINRQAKQGTFAFSHALLFPFNWIKTMAWNFI